MSNTRPEPPVDLGIYSRPAGDPGLDPLEKLAVSVSGAWLVFCVVFLMFFGVGEGSELGPLRFLVVIMTLILPIGLIWIAAVAVKGARIMRDESERLQASMDAMRQIYITNAQMAATAMGPNVERKIDEIVKGQKRAETALASFASSRQPSRPRPEPAEVAPAPQPSDQPALELSTPDDDRPDVSIEDFIVALNFPETADDVEGFNALRRALASPRAAKLVRASQDVLTLLSQDGIYMDDLAPDRARPEVWRRFASGDRGQSISGLGGIRDRSSLALSSARMRQDSIFRDAAHHFLRTFDKTFAAIADELDDKEIVQLTDTRTARAFMLLGRVAGIFD